MISATQYPTRQLSNAALETSNASWQIKLLRLVYETQPRSVEECSLRSPRCARYRARCFAQHVRLLEIIKDCRFTPCVPRKSVASSRLSAARDWMAADLSRW